MCVCVKPYGYRRHESAPLGPVRSERGYLSDLYAKAPTLHPNNAPSRRREAAIPLLQLLPPPSSSMVHTAQTTSHPTRTPTGCAKPKHVRNNVVAHTHRRRRIAQNRMAAQARTGEGGPIVAQTCIPPLYLPACFISYFFQVLSACVCVCSIAKMANKSPS